MPKLSVVVPALNGSEKLRSLLASLFDQTLPRSEYEVVVVDDGSRPSLASLARQYPVVYRRQKHRGAGAARNKGVVASRGDWLVFTDSDCQVEKDWLANHLRLARLRDEKQVLVGGGVKRPRTSNLVAWADYLTAWFNVHEDLPARREKEYLPSLNWSLKKEVFDRVGGFEEGLTTGEDVIFCLRARQKGVRLFFEPSLGLTHQSHGLIGLVKHNYQWGVQAPQVRGRHKELTYHWLFSGERLRSCFLFGPLVIGKTLFLAGRWWRYYPGRFLVCLPLILTANVAYAWGVVRGTRR